MITIENLSYTYKKGLKPVLESISLEIREGEYICIIGPNGCGKTTLIRQMNALLLPCKGRVVVDGLVSHEAKNHREIRRRVGMVFQNPDNQIVGMSVEEDVAFGPGNLNLPSRVIRLRVHEALNTVGLSGMEKRMPHTLSGGEKQLLALAGLLAMEPGYIILDEATSSLDAASKEKIMAILSRLNNQGITVIHVTHNMDEALRADRVILMDGGQIVADGRAFEILARADLLKSLGLAPPVIVELMMRLKPFKNSVPPEILSVEDAAREINRWLQGSIPHENKAGADMYD